MKEDLLKRIENEVLIIIADALEFLKNLEIDQETFEKFINYIKENNVKILDKSIVESFFNKKVVKEEKKIEITKKEKENILSFLRTTKRTEDENKIKIEQKTVIEINKEIIEKKKRFVGEEVETKIREIKNTNIPLIKISRMFVVQKNKPDIQSWINYYKKRYRKIKEKLKEHIELKNIYPLNSIPQDKEVGIVGMLYDKRISENGIIFIIEDGIKYLKVFVPNELIKENKLIKDVPLDSVLGFIGQLKGNIFIANKVIFPDIPRVEQKSIDEDIYILFTGDWQIGSRYVIKEVLDNFIKFINAKTGNEKLDSIARKVGYISIIGDNVDGVGVYPNQDQELLYKSIEKQYEEFENIIKMIPESINIVFIPGNHDLPRLAEPQPPLPTNLFKEIYKYKNVFITSNPSYVEIHGKFKLLLYHGYSFDWFVSEIPYIRENGGYERPEVIMKVQLLLRHLSPMHGSTPYIPYFDEDPLVIDDVPDFMHTGHIHTATYSSYKGVDLINSSTFQDTTPYQIEMGHKPIPGIVYLRNLKNGEVLAIDLKNMRLHVLRERF